MRSYLTLACSLILSIGLIGCDSGGTGGGTDAGPMTDAGAIELPDSGGSACSGPTADFGTSEGSNFTPLNLTRCDGSAYEFYGEDEGFCDASFTVLIMSAGWCGPCRNEAAQMESLITQAYKDQGVRVITALMQDNNYSAPDGAFCDGWVSQYGLTNDVLLDPAQETQIYFPAGSLPANLIIDSNGVIRHREYGAAPNLETIRAALEQLLEE